MLERVLLCPAAATALILCPAAARADVAVPGEHRVPSEVVFTGLDDFPAYRFVAAVSTLRPGANEGVPLDRGIPAGEGDGAGAAVPAGAARADGLAVRVLRARTRGKHGLILLAVPGGIHEDRVRLNEKYNLEAG